MLDCSRLTQRLAVCCSVLQEPRTKTIKAALNPRWENKHVPRLSCVVGDIKHLKQQHLFAHVWDKDRGADDLIGTAIISLEGCELQGEPMKFSCDVLRDGQVHGKLSGRIAVSGKELGQDDDLEPPASPGQRHTAEVGESLGQRVNCWAPDAPAPFIPDSEHDILNVRIVTWNSGNARPPADLRPLFVGRPGDEADAPAEVQPDLVVFGQQESSFNVAKEQEGKDNMKGRAKIIGTLRGCVTRDSN